MKDDPAPPLSARQLRDTLVEDVRTQVEQLAARFFPGLELPGYFIGQRVTSMDRADFAYVLVHLYQLGVEAVAGVPIREAVQRLLRPIDGPATTTFYSYRVAESLLAFGPSFEGNPLLEGMTGAELENLREATDTTAIYDPATRRLTNHPNNYWAVLARCELRRQQLGILPDPAVLDIALEELGKLLFGNGRGFFDDSPELAGRYDIYSADVHLFCEPLWPRLDAPRITANLRTHCRWLESVVMENGAFVAYGRSAGALSVCMTMELGAVALRLGLASDPARSLGLIDHARRAFFGEWLDGGLITAHRHRATEAYRGVYRMLQMTLDCLGKICFVSRQLEAAPAVEALADAPVLFPEIDEWLVFEDARPAGLWMFRNAQVALQFPCIDGYNADYAPGPRAPGWFENPVDSALVCALPRVARGGTDYSIVGLPVSTEKTPGGLRVVYDGFRRIPAGPTPERLPGRREAQCRVEGDTLSVDERWNFDSLPDAVTFHLPESARSLKLEIISAPDGTHASTAEVAGMAEWRSCWGETRRVHQVNFPPATEIRFSYRLRPVLKVAVVPHHHDYLDALYKAMRPGEIVRRGVSDHARIPDAAKLAAEYAGDADILHVGWPEHLFSPDGVPPEEFLQRCLDFVEALGRLPVRVVWTQHNRRPHAAVWRARDPDNALYHAWAAIADGVIHHSEWGMKLMRAELAYRSDARHLVLPHGHYAAQMPPRAPRAELEARFGLEPAVMRFGVVGRAQPEKQVELIVRAFRAANRVDQQLFVTAIEPGEVAETGNPQVRLLPRHGWLSREEIAAQLQVCDALVCAQTGDTYLTSGSNADAIGAGLAMLAPDWGYFRDTLGEAAFYHDNTEAGLTRLFAMLGADDLARGKAASAALQSASAWPKLAAETLAFFRSLPRVKHPFPPPNP